MFPAALLAEEVERLGGRALTVPDVAEALDLVLAGADPDDVVLSNHRNHGHFLTYSGDFAGLVAEIMGREAGVCGGWGGSQHLAFRHFHSNGVQGGMTAIAPAWRSDASYGEAVESSR